MDLRFGICLETYFPHLASIILLRSHYQCVLEEASFWR